MTRQLNRRLFILLPLAILAALALTAAVLARHDAPPAAAIGENSLAFPDPHPTDNIGTESSMQLDSNGFPVVAYTAQIPGATAVRLLHCNDVVCAGGDDSIETVFSSTSGIVNPSLSLDTSGNPIITFLHGGINVMHCNDANCDGNDESLVTPVVGCCELYSSHVLAAGDLPVIVFRQNGLQIVRCANTNCTAVTNDPGFIVQPEPTSSNSITLDAAGLPVIAYSGADGLRLLHCNDINCAGGDESVQSLDGSLTGRHTAIKLVDGNPVIAYTGNTSGTSQIKIARCDDPNCAPGGDTLQSASTTAGDKSSPSLAIDSADNSVVSYYQTGANKTRLLHCNDAACASADESDVPAAEVGGSGAAHGATSIALDASGQPVVSLYAADGNDSAILYCGDANCSVPPLPTPTNTHTATNTSAPTATHTPAPPTATNTPATGPLGRIVFTSNRGSSNFELIVMDGDGANPTCLTNAEPPFDSYRPDWSPDATKVAFTRNVPGGDREIFVVGADGSNPTNLTNSPAFDDEAAWSPDGSKIAFASSRGGNGNSDIWVMDADGSNLVNLTDATDGDYLDEFPAWSPDGTKIAFLSYRDTSTSLNAEIYVMNASGSNPEQLSNNVADDTMPAWSPNGASIAFASTRDGNYEVYVMDADDGANQTRLTDSPVDDFIPRYSPNGTQIAFTTNRDGNYEIYAMGAAGSNPTNLTNSPGTDSQPSWVGLTPIDPVCPPPEPTATPTASNTPTITPTPSDTATNTPVPPTPTITNTPVPPTATGTPTNTPIPPSATSTPIPPSATSTPIPPSATSTPIPPSATSTPIPPSATSTPIPPSATSTPIPPTATHTATNTPIPPTATHTATNTSVPPTPTNTPVPTMATSTPVPPTATATAVPPTATHTSTNTPVPPTSTSTPIPPTNTPVNTTTSTPVPPTATHTSTNTPIPPTATSTSIASTATATPVGDRCADLNGDGRVNIGDILRIAVHMFRPYSAAHDINRDGQVSIADLLAAARQWGRRTC